MADAVATQKILDGSRKVVMKFTNISDGTGESAVTKVDVSTLSPAASEVKIDKIIYDVGGMTVQILWDATADVVAHTLSGEGKVSFKRFGGLVNNAGSGVTGDILFTTIGAASGDTYSITLEMDKR